MTERNFGPLLRDYRQRLGMSPREMAEIVGIHFATIAHMEKGAKGPPSAEMIVKITKALQVDHDLLLIAANKIDPEIYRRPPQMSNSPTTVRRM